MSQARSHLRPCSVLEQVSTSWMPHCAARIPVALYLQWPCTGSGMPVGAPSVPDPKRIVAGPNIRESGRPRS